MKNVGCEASYLTSSLIPTIRFADADAGRERDGCDCKRRERCASFGHMVRCDKSDSLEHRVGDPRGTEAYRVGRREAGLVLGGRDRRAGGVVVEVARVEGDRDDPRRAVRSATRSRAARTSSESGGIGKRSSPSTNRCPAWWQRTSACGALPWSSPSVTPEYAGCSSDPWPSTQRSSPPRSIPSSTSCSEAPARKSATTASTEIPHPAIAIPVWPVGNELALEPAAPRLGVELERDGHLPDRAVGADREHDPRVVGEVAAGRRVEARRRLPQIAELDSVTGGEDAELGIVRDELVEAALDVEAGGDAGLEELAPGGREPAAASSRRRRARSSGRTRGPRRPSPTIGKPSCDSPARVESRIATTCSGR